MPEVELQIQLTPELWDQVARWINQNAGGDPPPLQILSVGATLLHVAATSWVRYEPAPEAAELVKFDEEAFVALARQMYRKAKTPTPARPKPKG